MGNKKKIVEIRINLSFEMELSLLEKIINGNQQEMIFKFYKRKFSNKEDM